MLATNTAPCLMYRRQYGAWLSMFLAQSASYSLTGILINSSSSMCLIMHAMRAVVTPMSYFVGTLMNHMII